MKINTASVKLNPKMYTDKNTIFGFRNLIILENFYGINRSFLIGGAKMKLFCNFVFVFTITAILGITVYDLYYHANDMKTSIAIFQLFLAFELIYLSVGARERKSIIALQRLDEKCSVEEEYLSHIKRTVNKTVAIAIASTILDYIGASATLTRKSVILTFCVTLAAHEAEMIFYSIIFEGINFRLSKIESMPLNCAWRVYRHVLIASLSVSEVFTGRILLMLTSAFITTVVYAVILIVIDHDMVINLFVVLAWRESKSLYTLWVLCRTAAKTKYICNRLVFVLVGRLVLYSKDSRTITHQATRQLISCMRSIQPRYLSGSVMTLDLAVPLDLMDLSINYLLIIVQIYIAFKNA